MRRLLKPLLLPLLRREPAEIDRLAQRFRIDGEHGRRLLEQLGRAFLGGYNAMLELDGPQQVRERGEQVDAHFRPFYFEGAAMGYLPRGYFTSGNDVRQMESVLLGMDPRFRYLYYVGIGFWYGFRHRRRPERLLELEPHLDSMYFPLCFDGFGFKTGFFDYARDPAAAEVLDRCPSAFRRFAHQGFGRALFFVFMDDGAGWSDAAQKLAGADRLDLETGRALARAFTGIDRPPLIIEQLASAADEQTLAARLLGITWALAARRMNDSAYYERCLAAAGGARPFLEALPDLCDAALAGACDYEDWQNRTRESVLDAYREHAVEA